MTINKEWTKWKEDSFFDNKRQIGDPLADDTITAVFEAGAVDAVNELMRTLVHNDDVIPDNLPPAVTHYLEESAKLPAWADPDLIQAGEEVFIQRGVFAFAILAAASLPEAYVDHKGAPVLYLTQKLITDADRRITETGQMVIRVMARGGLAEGGAGIRAAQKVRLMHAAVRHLILTDPPDNIAQIQPKTLGHIMLEHKWSETLGKPVNQEDLAYTLMTFSHVIIRSFAVLGHPLTEEEKAAYIHCWNVVGHIMGIDQDLLPNNAEQAEMLFERIKGRLQGHSIEGETLTKAIILYMEEGLPTLLKNAPQMLVRILIGDTTADLLNVPPLTTFEKIRINGYAIFHRIMELIRGNRPKDHIELIADLYFRHLVKRSLARERTGNKGQFYIPDELATSWKIL